MVEAKKDVKTAAGPAEETVKQVVEEEVKAAAPAAEAPAAKETKAPAKAAAAKAAPAKKPAAKKAEPAAAVHFQFDGKDLVAKDVLDQAVKAYKSTHKGVGIKTIELYIVANEGAAYYVVNGEGNDDFKIML